jgi:hypothetical protein
LNTFKKPSDQIRNAILKNDDKFLTSESIERLIECVPTSEEITQLEEYVKKGGDPELLGEPERFLLIIKVLPELEIRLRSLLYKMTFSARCRDIQPKIQTVNKTINDLKSSNKLLKFAEIALAIGNFMNGQKAGAMGFKIENLNKLIDTKTIDNQRTLLHYMVSMIESKNPEVLSLGKDFPSLEDASKISFTGIQTDFNELQSQHKKLSSQIDQVKPFSASDTFDKIFPSAMKEMEVQIKELQTLLETTQKAYLQLELSFRGQNEPDSDPQEFFTQFHKFIVNLNSVTSDLEMARVKKDRAEKLEKKEKSALMAEIEKGIKLKPMKKPEIAAPAAKAKNSMMQTKSKMSEMGNIAQQIAKRNQERAKQQQLRSPSRTQSGSTKGNSSRLDILLQELGNK